jgi:hypothetical protein
VQKALKSLIIEIINFDQQMFVSLIKEHAVIKKLA